MSGDWSSPDPYSPDGEFVAVSAGRPHMCGVRVGGALACWRHPYYDDPSPVLSPPAGRFASVSVGGSQACAVRVDGGAVCWGDDRYGETTPPPGRFVDVAVGGPFSCGLRSDGEVVCWGLRRRSDPGPYWYGWNNDGGLWPRGPFTALDVIRATEEICALRVSGGVVCWNNGTATHRPPDGAFVALDAGPYATCGLRPDGEVACWGWDQGRDNFFRAMLPVAWDVPSGPFTALSVGDGYACGLRPDGEVACWGHGKFREKRSGVSETRDERENRRRLEPPPGPFTALSAGDEFTCGLRPDGEVACWGMSNTHFGDELSESPPGPFSAVRAGDDHACGLRPDGRVTCWRSSTFWDSYVYLNERFGEQTTLDGTWAALTGGDELACGLRPGGQFACADADNVLSRLAPAVAFGAVAAWGHACGLDHRGEITCWSHRGHREPAPPGPVHRRHHRQLVHLRAAPRRHRRMLDNPLAPHRRPRPCGFLRQWRNLIVAPTTETDAGDRVLDRSQRASPFSPAPLAPMRTWRMRGASSAAWRPTRRSAPHATPASPTSNPWATRSRHPRRPQGDPRRRLAAMRTPARLAAFITAAVITAACATDSTIPLGDSTDGVVRGAAQAGDRGGQQAGDGIEERVGGGVLGGNVGSGLSAPAGEASGGEVVSLHASWAMVCGLRGDGRVECFGGGGEAQRELEGGRFRALSFGRLFGCGVRVGGRLVCWGEAPSALVTSPRGDFIDVAVAEDHVCAVRAGGELACWGNDRWEGWSAAAAWDGLELPGGGFTAVSAGWLHVCGLRAGGEVVCRDVLGETWSLVGRYAAISSAWDPYQGTVCGLSIFGGVNCGNQEGTRAVGAAGKFVSVSLGGEYGCGVRADGSLACWGQRHPGECDKVLRDECWGWGCLSGVRACWAVHGGRCGVVADRRAAGADLRGARRRRLRVLEHRR